MQQASRWLIGSMLVVMVSGCNLAIAPKTGGGGDPVAWIDEPLDGSSYPVGDVPVIVHATGPSGISSIKLDVNGSVVMTWNPDSQPGELAQEQYTWSPTSPGNYTLQVSSAGPYQQYGAPAQAVVSITGAGTPQVATMSTQCTFTAASDTDIYMRPSLNANVFYHASAGFSAQIQAQTSDGWLGFDPGVAQAANTGPFRLRWIPPNTASTTGDCGGLPQVWGPPPGLCFLMPMTKINVYSSPDSTSSVVTTLDVDQYAEIDAIQPDHWVHVDLSSGNTGSNTTGWVSPQDVNLNGHCDLEGVATATPVPTATSTPASQLSVNASPPSSGSVYFGSGSCSPASVRFGATSSDASATKSIVFFYRLKDKGNGQSTGWSQGQAMNPDGGGHYSLSLSGRDLDHGTGFNKAVIDYQFALEPNQGEIVRSQVYTDVQLLRCGTIVVPPPVTINTPTPTLISILPLPIPINTPTVPVIR